MNFIFHIMFIIIFIIINYSNCGRVGWIDNMVCGVTSKRGSKILHGNKASEGEFPWQISLQLKQNTIYRHICGGSIIHPLWVVTAAHCVNEYNITDILIIAGDNDLKHPSSNSQRRQVIAKFTHNYDSFTYGNDIALLKLEEPFKLNDNIMPICLPSAKDVFQASLSCIVSGWGIVGENARESVTLTYVILPIIKKSICDDSYKKIGFSYYLNECQVCAGYLQGGRDACQGDSGGGLICRKDERYYLCGIVSWGYGCGRPFYPGMYTKVSCFTDWIRNTMYNHTKLSTSSV